MAIIKVLPTKFAGTYATVVKNGSNIEVWKIGKLPVCVAFAKALRQHKYKKNVA